MSVLRTMSPMTNSWSAPHKCTVRLASGVSGAPALVLGELVASGGVRRRAPGWSCSIHHRLAAPVPTSQRSRSAWSRGEGVQVEGKTKTDETATTGETKPARRCSVTGRGSGTRTQANGTTLTTGTKQSKGDEETSALNLSHLRTDSAALVPWVTKTEVPFSFSALSL